MPATPWATRRPRSAPTSSKRRSSPMAHRTSNRHCCAVPRQQRPMTGLPCVLANRPHEVDPHDRLRLEVAGEQHGAEVDAFGAVATSRARTVSGDRCVTRSSTRSTTLPIGAADIGMLVLTAWHLPLLEQETEVARAHLKPRWEDREIPWCPRAGDGPSFVSVDRSRSRSSIESISGLVRRPDRWVPVPGRRSSRSSWPGG
jgi:hypothetical protein